MDKILLLGGTGALGEYLIENLIESNYDVYITSRKEHKNYKNIHYLCGNAKEINFLDELLINNYECIIDFMIWKTNEFNNVINKILNKTDHYIFLSSYRVYANSDLNSLSEESPLLVNTCTDKEYLQTDEYALAKGRSEEILKKSQFSNYTIIRPAITFSKFRFQIGTLEASTIIPRTIKKLPILLPNEILNKYAAVSWAGDVGKMIYFLLGKDKSKREIFNVASAEKHTWREIATYYHNLIGTNIKICGLNDYINIVGGKYQIYYDRMFNRIIDNTKILKFMNITQNDLCPIEVALRKELKNIECIKNKINENELISKKMDKVILKMFNKIKISESNNIERLNHNKTIKKMNTNINNKIENTKKNVGILNFHFSNNYGAVLVPYAMKIAIETMGYKTEIINYVAQKFSRQPAFVKFRGKYLAPMSREFSHIDEMRDYHDTWSRIVVGSDQVWRMFQTDIYMLSWAFGKCSLISYAASFGHDLYSGSISKSKACELLHRFDAISVREKSGVDICINDFGINAVQVLDPTLLLSETSYNKIINEENITIPNEPYICCILLNTKYSSYISNPNKLLNIKNKYKIINPIKDENNQYRSVAEWLALIKNAKYVISDSFHGTVFSIIFKKQFISLMYNDFNGNSRIPSLLSSIGISTKRIIHSIDDLSLELFNNKIDYQKVDTLLKPLKNKSFLFLKNALNEEPIEKDEKLYIDCYEAIKYLNNQDNISKYDNNYYKKWIELKLAETIEFSSKIENLENEILYLKNNNFYILKFCVYWMYRALFRISFGNLKVKFKERRAFYRKLIKGK